MSLDACLPADLQGPATTIAPLGQGPSDAAMRKSVAL
jgi:hypothetical protein